MVLEKFRPKIKESLKDPDMCHCVKTMVRNQSYYQTVR